MSQDVRLPVFDGGFQGRCCACQEYSVSWWVFGLAGLSTILLTLLIISWQTIKAAMQNPVESLKVE